MFAVGIDVSSRKRTVAVLSSQTNIVMKPFDVPHTPDGLGRLADKLNALDGEIRIVMEHTGRYYEAVAMSLHNLGFFVSAVNPLLIRDFSDNSLRKVKTDNADAVKIARYTLANWETLRQYTPEEEIRYLLKTLNTQYQLAVKTLTAHTNNLIALMEQTYPGVKSLFTSPARPDGSQKWMDYACTFWHVDCVCSLTEAAFAERYRKWCKRHHCIQFRGQHDLYDVVIHDPVPVLIRITQRLGARPIDQPRQARRKIIDAPQRLVRKQRRGSSGVFKLLLHISLCLGVIVCGQKTLYINSVTDGPVCLRLQLVPQFRLPGQDQRKRILRIHFVVQQESDLFQHLTGQQMVFVNDDHKTAFLYAPHDLDLLMQKLSGVSPIESAFTAKGNAESFELFLRKSLEYMDFSQKQP